MTVAIALQIDSPPGGLERARLLACLEQADSLKLDSVWIREAGAGEPAHLQDCATAVALAGSTRICLCGVALPLHHPVRVAEDLATLDVMRGGGIELALRPLRPAGPAGVAELGEQLALLRRAWSGNSLPLQPSAGSTSGFSVYPRPTNPDSLTLWVDGLGAAGRGAADWAALLGTGLLASGERAMLDYLAGWKREGRDPGSARIALQLRTHERSDVSAALEELEAIARRIGSERPGRLLGILRHPNLEKSV